MSCGMYGALTEAGCGVMGMTVVGGSGVGTLGGATVKLIPLLHPPVRARTDARTNPSAQRATQLRSALARVYAVSRQNQITTTVP
jgi:hypothetical protein